jgi:WD40-like Beta Propeller Repeat
MTAVRRILVMVATALVAGLVAPGAHATNPGTNGRIAFTILDGHNEIASINPNGTDQRFVTTYPDSGWWPAWSPDGTQIAYLRNFYDLYKVNADGTGITALDPQASSTGAPTWAPDGTKLAYISNPYTAFLEIINADGSDKHALPLGASQMGGDPAWSPAGEPIASNGIWTFNPDGSGTTRVTSAGEKPDWSPDYQRLVFEFNSGLATTVVGTGVITPIPGTGGFYDPVWSPDGNLIAATGPGGLGTGNEIYTMKPDGSDITRITFFGGSQPSWQRLDPPPAPPPGYPRPRGGTPLHVSLVTAYPPCPTGQNGSSPNSSHGAPLSYPSCSPPAERGNLTVGTADSNGAAAKFVGSVVLDAVVGDPSTAANEADVKLKAHLTDVRCRAPINPDPGPGTPCTAEMGDYTGELEGKSTLRITDERSGYQHNVSATLQDLPFRFTIPCTATADTTVGSTCDVATTINSITPGEIQEGARTTWALDQVRIDDGGIDGQGATEADNLSFVDQGVFVP